MPTFTQLPFVFNEESVAAANRYIELSGFVVAASFNPDVVAAAHNWMNKRGGDLHPEDIRWLRRTLKTVDGYGDWIWEYENFLDLVAEEVCNATPR